MATGVIVEDPVTERTIGITAGELRDVDRVVAVAGGSDKAAAVSAVLATGMVTHVVTDREVAEAALAGA